MECNKDDAIRAKEIAETKLTQKDIVGAQKFAIKAHNLFPQLEGLSQFVATLDMYVAAEKKINGDVDWYGVLGVDPLADDETIRKSYRKLALILHPDKNKSTGADGAFKLVSEAWSMLSDKARKIAYDQKRNFRATVQKVVLQNSTVPTGKNGFHSSAANHHKTSSNPQPANVFPHPSKPNTFWTSCVRCHMHYEYLRDYINLQLLCPSCKHPFLAAEMLVPNRMQQQKQNLHGGVGAAGASVQRGTSSKSSTVRNNEKLKRGRPAEAPPEIKSKVPAPGSSSHNDGESVKKRHMGEHKWNGNRKNTPYQMAMGHAKSACVYGKPNSMRELSLSETRTMLMTKARSVIIKKLSELNLAEKIEREKAVAAAVDRKKAAVSSMRKEGDSNGSSVNIKSPVQSKQSLKPAVDMDMDMDTAPAEIMSMSVPDPDFHDFDRDRTEKSFGENQVWAAYDDDDGMPRFYALIHTVLSKMPFKMRISWLNSKSNAELGPMNWIGSGFPKTSGDFRVGKHEVNGTLNAFSHKVKWTKGKKGVIQIFPAKGDVWALYRNWSPEWNEHTADELVHKYEMVEVLEDYIEEQGVTITPLVKVAGFKSVFHQHLDVREARKIPREEMFRFSHQVPSYLLTGQEAQNVTKGSRELDPAAMPSELLQVIAEDKVVENVENAKEESHASETSRRTEGKRVITYARKNVAKNAKGVKGNNGPGSEK